MLKFHFGCIKDSVSQAEKQAGSPANGNLISLNSWKICNIDANLIAVFIDEGSTRSSANFWRELNEGRNPFLIGEKMKRQLVSSGSLYEGVYFKEIRPASTIVQVAGFIEPKWLVEIEADAVISDEAGKRS
jgi:hypothetical protein